MLKKEKIMHKNFKIICYCHNSNTLWILTNLVLAISLRDLPSFNNSSFFLQKVNAKRIMTGKRRDGWIKLLFCFVFAHKKYSRHFIKLRLNHCSHVFFNDVFSTFLNLESVDYIAVYGRVIYLSDFITNILMCVLKMKVLQVLMTEFLGELTL